MGHHRPASETPFKWHFAGWTMMARLKLYQLKSKKNKLKNVVKFGPPLKNLWILARCIQNFGTYKYPFIQNILSEPALLLPPPPPPHHLSTLHFPDSGFKDYDSYQIDQITSNYLNMILFSMKLRLLLEHDCPVNLSLSLILLEMSN